MVAPDAIDPNLRDKVDRRITNNNETILKSTGALSEVPSLYRL